MDDNDFWMWTLFFALLSCIIIRAICFTGCYMTNQERMRYTRLSKPLNKEPCVLYSINSKNINKIDSENV